MREMQHPEHGVPVRSQKLFLTSIPSAFMGEYVLRLFGFRRRGGMDNKQISGRKNTETFYDPRKIPSPVTFSAAPDRLSQLRP